MFESGYPTNWSTLKKLIWVVGSGVAGASEVWNTVSGTIASFTTKIAAPVQKLVATIEPVQDLHGHDSPWPAGGGKNKLDASGATTSTRSGVTFTVNKNEDGSLASIVANGTSESNYSQCYVDLYRSDDALGNLIAGETYIASINTSATLIFIVGLYKTSSSGYIMLFSPTAVDVTFTLPSDATGIIIRACIANSGMTVNNAVGYPMIRLATEADATFEPYSNLCPISGWTGAEIEQTGKNLFDANTAHLVNNSATSQRYGVSFDKPGEYTIKANKSTGSAYIGAKVIYADRSFGSAMYIVSNGIADAAKTVTLTTGQTLIIYNINTGTEQDSKIILGSYDIQVELGSTATAYEPYTGNQISVTFPETIYGGEDEVISGKLKKTMGMVDLGTLNWYSINGRFNTTSSVADAKKGNHMDCLCSVYKSDTGAETRTVDGAICFANDGYIYVYDTSFVGDASAFKAAMSGVQLCYELAEPVEYTLTGNEMETIYGTNNIWANTGDVEVTYRER